MHSNRDAKRIDRRRGDSAVVSAKVDPEIRPAYSASNRESDVHDSRLDASTLNCLAGPIYNQKPLYK